MKRKWDTEKEGQAEVPAEDSAEATSADQKKCIKQFVQIVARNAKFLLSQVMTQTENQDRFTVGTATKNTNLHEGSKFFLIS